MCPTIALTFDLCPVRKGGGYDRALVDYCLGKRTIKWKAGTVYSERPAIAPLVGKDAHSNQIHEAVTIVGVLGSAEDARALHPFLQSENDSLALGAAMAVIRPDQ